MSRRDGHGEPGEGSGLGVVRKLADARETPACRAMGRAWFKSLGSHRWTVLDEQCYLGARR
jgi:hypothetical protein